MYSERIDVSVVIHFLFLFARLSAAVRFFFGAPLPQLGELHVLQSVILVFIEAFQVEPLELAQDIFDGC